MLKFPKNWVDEDPIYCMKASDFYDSNSEYLDGNFVRQFEHDLVTRVWELEFCKYLEQEGFERLTQEKRRKHHFRKDFPDFIISTEMGFIGIECTCPEDDEPVKRIEEEQLESGNAVWTNEDARILRITHAVVEKRRQYGRHSPSLTSLDAYYVAVSIGRLPYMSNEAIERSLYGVGLPNVFIDINTRRIVNEGRNRETFINKNLIHENNRIPKVFLDPNNEIVKGIYIGQSHSQNNPRNYSINFFGRPVSPSKPHTHIEAQ